MLYQRFLSSCDRLRLAATDLEHLWHSMGGYSANTGNGAAASYQQVSVPTTTAKSPATSTPVLPPTTDAAQGATVDIGDSVMINNLQMLGTMRANQAARQTDITNLEAATQSQDATQQTIMATLQRINQPCFCNSVPSRTRTRLKPTSPCSRSSPRSSSRTR